MVEEFEVLKGEKEKRQAFYDHLDEKKAEFINGTIYHEPPVGYEHAFSGQNFLYLLNAFVDVHELGFVGHEKLLISLKRNDYEPDICFWPLAVSTNFTSGQLHFPVPAFVAEVISPSTESRDRGIKLLDYAANGILEYWLVNTSKLLIEQYILEGSSYKLITMATGKAVLCSTAIPSFETSADAIFNKDENLKLRKSIYRE